MLDIKLLRQETEAVARNLSRRGTVFDRERFDALESRRKALQVEVESGRQQRNDRSKEIGRAKARGEDIEPLRAEVSRLGEALEAAEQELGVLAAELDELLAGLPNMLQDDVPDGADDSANVEVSRWGEPRSFDFEPLDHLALGERLGLIDMETAARIAGSRFVILEAQLARLHRALTQFMLDLHTTEHGYRETYVPYLANDDALFGTGQLPKFAADLFAVDGATKFHLIPTAEVPLTNMVRERILTADELPLRLTAHTPCFRSEAGSYGKDTRGMFRQHQFEKIELVHIARPDDSEREHQLLLRHAEEVLRRLELPYRVMILSAGDTSAASSKTFDIEVWLPGQGQFREISSCSNFQAYQARRMQARWRNPATGRPEPVHTLNGSGVAVGRALIAVLENCQQADGSIRVPAALAPYMGGVELIGP
jgi:seryl-tRNA synthetase